jgi:isochorismate synthase EntC
LRSALVRGDGATAWAGAGIVARSQPRAEFTETELKLRTVLGPLLWGAP